MRVTLPDLKTAGWFNGSTAEREFSEDDKTVQRSGFAGDGLFRFFREWTTAHVSTRKLATYHHPQEGIG